MSNFWDTKELLKNKFDLIQINIGNYNILRKTNNFF